MRKNLKRFMTTAIILALLTGCAGSNASDAGKTGDAAQADAADNILTHEEAAENMEESGSEPLSGTDAAGSSQASSGEAGSGTDASAGADAKKPEELLGTKFPDFTMKTVDGGTFTLSEALKEKQVVLINMFATWCGPCKMEFPEMIRSYEERKDYVDVFAFSHDHENGDSEEKLKKFAGTRSRPRSLWTGSGRSVSFRADAFLTKDRSTASWIHLSEMIIRRARFSQMSPKKWSK